MNIGKFPKEFRRVVKRTGGLRRDREKARKPAAGRDDAAHAAPLGTQRQL